MINRIRFTIQGVLLFLAYPALSADENKEDKGPVIEQITVTATYRDTKLMDTAISISVLSEDELIDKGIIDIQTLYQSIPGLSYRTNANTYNTITVRGITPPGNGGSTVGIYIDEVPITDSSSGAGIRQVAGALFDLKRIEVLKGPQGTLYGEGNLGGALRYITKDADPNNWDFKVQGVFDDNRESDDIGSRINAVVNIPLLQDKLGVRIAGWYRDTPGILDISGDPADFRRNADDVDTHEEEGVRVKAKWDVSDTLEVSLMGNYLYAKYGGPANAEFDYGSATEFNHIGFENGGDDRQIQANVTVKYAMSFADLSVSTSYYHRDIDFAEETTERFAGGIQGLVNFVYALPLGLITFPEALDLRSVVLAIGGHNGFVTRTERFTEEIRLVSTTESRWQWVTGIYYKDDTSVNGQSFAHGPSFDYTLRPEFESQRDALDALFISFGIGGETQVETEELAAYGEISYAIDDQWEILFGLRVANVTKEVIGEPEEIDDTMYSPKVVLTWRPNNNLMAYATFAQGFRPGLVNVGIINERNAIEAAAASGMPILGDAATGSLSGAAWLAQYNKFSVTDGDEVLNYELGVKTTLLDGRMTLIGSIYYLDWKDTFILSEVPCASACFGGDVAFNGNNSEAHSQGIELQTTIAVIDRLYLTLGGDWNDEAEIETTAAGQFTFPITAGNRLANAPKYSYNASLSYKIPLFSGWQGSVNIDWYRVADSFNRASNELKTPGYHLLNAKFIMTAPDNTWRVALFVDNVHDEAVIYEHNEVGFRFGRPRSIGVDITYHLGG